MPTPSLNVQLPSVLDKLKEINCALDLMCVRVLTCREEGEIVCVCDIHPFLTVMIYHVVVFRVLFPIPYTILSSLPLYSYPLPDPPTQRCGFRLALHRTRKLQGREREAPQNHLCATRTSRCHHASGARSGDTVGTAFPECRAGFQVSWVHHCGRRVHWERVVFGQNDRCVLNAVFFLPSV
jgi:hypothetical protein